MNVDRVHNLAQAAQVADLVGERVEQLLEVVEPMVAIQLAMVGKLGDPELVARVRNLEARALNLRRAVDAYRSVRP